MWEYNCQQDYFQSEKGIVQVCGPDVHAKRHFRTVKVLKSISRKNIEAAQKFLDEWPDIRWVSEYERLIAYYNDNIVGMVARENKVVRGYFYNVVTAPQLVYEATEHTPGCYVRSALLAVEWHIISLIKSVDEIIKGD